MTRADQNGPGGSLPPDLRGWGAPLLLLFLVTRELSLVGAYILHTLAGA